MRSILKFIVPVILLFVASRALAEPFLQEPPNCLQKNIEPCFVATKYRPAKIEKKGVKIWLSAESHLEISSNHAKLLSGELFYQSKEDYSFETGLITGIGSGNIWISHKSNGMDARTNVINFAGDVVVRSKLDRVELPIPSGFENWYSLKSGPEGVPRPVKTDSVKSQFFALFGSLSIGFEKQFATWSKAWQENPQVASQQYSEMVHRSLASDLERIEQLKRKREKDQQEKSQMRQMYRERLGLGDHGSEVEGPDPGPDSN